MDASPSRLEARETLLRWRYLLSSRTPRFSFLTPGTPRSPRHISSPKSPVRLKKRWTLRRRQRAKLFSISGNALGGLLMEILVRCTAAGSRFQPRVPEPGRRPPPHPTGAQCAPSLPQKTGNEKVGETVKEKVPEVKPAPGLSLRAQNPRTPHPVAAHRVQRSSRRPRRRSELEEERKRDGVKPWGGTGSFRLRFLFPVSYPPNLIPPSHPP